MLHWNLASMFLISPLFRAMSKCTLPEWIAAMILQERSERGMNQTLDPHPGVFVLAWWNSVERNKCHIHPNCDYNATLLDKLGFGLIIYKLLGFSLRVFCCMAEWRDEAESAGPGGQGSVSWRLTTKPTSICENCTSAAICGHQSIGNCVATSAAATLCTNLKWRLYTCSGIF